MMRWLRASRKDWPEAGQHNLIWQSEGWLDEAFVTDSRALAGCRIGEERKWTVKHQCGCHAELPDGPDRQFSGIYKDRVLHSDVHVVSGAFVSK